MRKKIIITFCILVLLNFVLADTLSKGGQIEVGGKKVTIKGISKDAVVIDVDGVSKIVRANELETINGVKISVSEIFYSDIEGSQAEVTAESLYSCGDGNCNEGETSDNCCRDCGCKNELECNDNKCREKPVNKCNSAAECDDNDSSTKDICTGSPKECKHIGGKICEKNEDCDDENECTKDECKNFDCFNTEIENCVSNNTKIGINKMDITNNTNASGENIEKIIEEKVSFFKKIINFFKSFFSKSSSGGDSNKSVS